MTLADELDDLSREARSRLLLALAERDRLERVLLMLPHTLREFSPRRVAEVLAEAACELSGARLALVVLPDRLPAPVVAGVDAAWLDAGFDPTRLAVLVPAFDGNMVHVADTARLDPATIAGQLNATLDGRSLRCLLALPISGPDARVSGVLLLAHHRANAFSERQMALVSALVTHLGHSIELSDSVAEQTRIATALQESLLPPLLPMIPGVEIAARYRPSGSGNLVGGDFYDVFLDRAGGWYLLLGDASGIGPEAAGLAGIARYTARALADPAPPPAEILGRINVALLRAASEGRFCTAVLSRFVRAEPAARMAGAPLEVSLASSGHPPAYLHRADGTVEPATKATGTILGVVEDAGVGEAELTLQPGDSLVFYTDGITEARDVEGEPFGDEGIAEVLTGATGRSAEGIARRLERAVLDHRSPDDRDDMAIVVVRVRPAR